MKLNLIILPFAIFGFMVHIVMAQPAFLNRTQPFKTNIPTRSLMPGAALDIDGDLVDDLAILDKGNLLKTVKSSGRHFSLRLLDSIKTAAGREWTLTAGDINNDGFQEVLTAGENNQGSIISIGHSGLTRKSLIHSIFAQGSNTVDINNDGWLDYYICNDDGPNKIYINNGSGNLVLTNVINFMLDDPTDGSGNYGSEWIDVNGDLLPDLCISKCRAGVEDPNDQRRINRLYINQGDGSFVEKGAEYGLNSGAQTWVTAFGDIDNDGDLDALVVNHYAPHELMENVDGKSFKKIDFPVLESFTFQAIMRDFDNDGWEDILLTGVEGSMLLHNNKDKTFTVIKDIIGPGRPRSFVCGDFNDDGFLDIHAHMAEPINDVGLTDDQLWLNQPNGNHYIKFNLAGKASNSSGIGTQIELYGSWGKQIRYVKGGESYGIFNSFQQVFGLGSAIAADSVIINWPSGVIDKYLNLAADKTYLVQEDQCMTAQLDLYQDVLVAKDTVVSIEASQGFVSYLWNNGKTDANIIENEGMYHVTMTDASGCKTISKPVVVISGCFGADKKLFYQDKNIKQCDGSVLEIFATQAASYEWQDGTTASSILVDESGWVSLSASDYCGSTLKDSILVEFVNIDWITKGDTVTKGSQAILTSSHPNTQWFEFPDFINPVFTGDTLITAPLESTTSYKAKTTEVIDKKVGFVGEKNFPSSNFYGSNTTAGSLIFNVERRCVLHSVNVSTDQEGLRRIIIKDIAENVIFTKDIMLPPGISRVVLDAALNPGFNYEISTDESINFATFGHKSPRLVRSFNNTFFPYMIENQLTILTSSFGAQYFMYFYDWEIHYEVVRCETDFVDVVATVEIENATDQTEANKYISIYPNPGLDRIYIKMDEKVKNAFIKNINQQVFTAQLFNETSLDISTWPSGLYLVTMIVNDKIQTVKYIKQ